MSDSTQIRAPRRVKITDQTGVWYATAGMVPAHLEGVALGRWLTKLAVKRGVSAIYEPATEEEYRNYRDKTTTRTL